MSYKFDAFVEDFMLDPPGHISDDGAKEDGKLVEGSDRKPWPVFRLLQLYHLTISACDLLNNSDVSKFVGKVTSYKFNDNFFALLSNNLPKTCHAQFLTSATRYFAMLISIGFMSFLTQSIL